jgi:hypothetical protein
MYLFDATATWRLVAKVPSTGRCHAGHWPAETVAGVVLTASHVLTRSRNWEAV